MQFNVPEIIIIVIGWLVAMTTLKYIKAFSRWDYPVVIVFAAGCSEDRYFSQEF
jgi:hypothetical protein